MADARTLRLLSLLLSTAFALPCWAAEPDEPASVRAMLEAGARELALRQIEKLQPQQRTAPRWAEWEGLRCEALARLNRYGAVLERARMIPKDTPASGLNACWVEAARAAVASGDAVAARTYAAALLWQGAPTGAQARAARLTVIDSYLAEKRAQDAFEAMLRFEGDYRPLERRVTEHFAHGLLELGHDADALHWIAREARSPARLRLQLKGGAVTPQSAAAQARAAFLKDNDPAWWRVVQDAALAARDGSLQIEALERLLQSVGRSDQAAQDAAAKRLWAAYLAAADEVGNREQLLTGDDGAWADYASRRLGHDPYLSRAFYAYLAQHAQSADVRRNAQLQLAYSLYSAGLDATALRAMQRIGLDVATLDEQTRYLLGTIAAKHNDAALALRLWDGLEAPPTVDGAEWALSLARIALQAGEAKRSAEIIGRLLAGRATVGAELSTRVLEIGQEMLDLRTIGPARDVYDQLVPLANNAHAREALFGLGRAHEFAGDATAAASHYLRSALLVQATAPDALAFQARLLAALNLMRAGLRDDARAQFEWLLTHAKDPALIEAAKRGLSRL